MKAFSATSTFFILLASYASSLPQDRERHVPTKRALLAFGQMVLCATNRNPLDYNLYGCYCGFGGKGEPVDDLDRCCKEHDECYTRVVEDNNNCSHDLATYALPYYRKSCLECEPPSYYWFLGECRAAICECDKEAALCFGGSKYNDENVKHDKSSC